MLCTSQFLSSNRFMFTFSSRRPRRRAKCEVDEDWEDWPSLGQGWKRKQVFRRSGTSEGRSDTYYMRYHKNGSIKGIVHPEIKMSKIIIYPQNIQDVDEFFFPSVQICKNLALQHLLTNRSSAVNSWESKQLIKTSQQSTSNPHNSSLSINVLWS